MGYQLIAAPGTEPVSVAEAKAHLRVEIPDEDALIGAIITATRGYCEQLTGRSLISQQWRLVMDCFPTVIEIEKGPVISVDSIGYVDMTGADQVAPSSAYVVDKSGPLARITPRFGMVWPIPMPQIGSVNVVFTAGYGAGAAAVPAGIKNWMLLRIGSLYKNREDFVVLQRGETVAPHPFIDSLLDPYRVWRI